MSFLTRARAIVSGAYLRPPERKFSPADPSVNWEYVNSLTYGPTAWGSTKPTGDANSAAFACLMVLANAVIEPRLRVYRDDGSGKPEPQDTHPLQALLDDPNPMLMPEEIWFWVTWALHVDGNAYLLKVRSGGGDLTSNTTGNVVELWPQSPSTMTPNTVRGSNDFISNYKRAVGSGQYEYVPPENVVHFRLGLDDADKRRGLAPFKRLVKAIGTDEEAEAFVAAFLGNYATPGTAVVFPPNVQLDEADAMRIKQRFADSFSGSRRGEPAVLNNGASIEPLGGGVGDTTMDRFRAYPEARIAAVLGVPPAMAGLNVGLQQTSNFASMKQVTENFTERKLVPLWRVISAKLSHRSGLREDFLASDPQLLVRYDTSTVRALQEDQDALHARMRADFASSVVSLEEARTAIGYDPEVAPDEIMLIASTVTPTLAGGLVPEPAVATPPSDAGASSGGGDQVPPQKDRKLRQDLLNRFPALLDSLVELQQPAMEADVQRVLDRQQRRVTNGLDQHVAGS